MSSIRTPLNYSLFLHIIPRKELLYFMLCERHTCISKRKIRADPTLQHREHIATKAA